MLKDLYKEYELLAKYNGGLDYERYCAIGTAIRALEQKPKTDILDRIRAEIMDFEEDIFHSTKDYSDYAAVRHCVEIIDKYKAESEAQDADRD